MSVRHRALEFARELFRMFETKQKAFLPDTITFWGGVLLAFGLGSLPTIFVIWLVIALWLADF